MDGTCETGCMRKDKEPHLTKSSFCKVDRSSYDRKRKVGSQLRPWDVGSGSGAYFFPEVLLVVRI